MHTTQLKDVHLSPHYMCLSLSFRIVCSSKPLVCGRYAVRVTKSIVEMLDLLDYQQEAKHELQKDLQSSLKLRAEAFYDSLPKDMQRSVSIACEYCM